MNADIDKARADFEAWFSDDGKFPKAVERSGEGYMLMQAQQAWTAWQAARATPSPAPILPPQLQAVHAFLDGSAPLDGVWFGEKHPTERGQFWWRKHLRDAAPTVKASQ